MTELSTSIYDIRTGQFGCAKQLTIAQVTPTILKDSEFYMKREVLNVLLMFAVYNRGNVDWLDPTRI